jgi:hypothetical protein
MQRREFIALLGSTAASRRHRQPPRSFGSAHLAREILLTTRARLVRSLCACWRSADMCWGKI